MADEMTVEGLPVPGYRPQKAAAIATVTALKEIEEHVLRLLDEVAADDEIEADMRWLVMGRAQIEQGFMAANRSIFKPERVEIASGAKTVWLIERGDSALEEPLYYAPADHGSQWTSERSDALELASAGSATMLARALAVGARVCSAHSFPPRPRR